MVSGFISQKLRTQQTVGEFLRYHREEQRLSLEQVAHDIKVIPLYLHYLEEGQYAKLPAKVYVMGFVRLYAERLGIDTHRALRIYNREHGIKKQVEKMRDPHEQTKRFDQLRFSFLHPQILRLALIIGIIVGAGIYLTMQISAFVGQPGLIIASPASAFTTTEHSVAISGHTRKASTISINGQAVAVGTDNSFSVSLPLAAGNNDLVISALDKYGNEESQTLTVVRETPSQNIDDERAAAVAIGVSVTTPTRLVVRVDEQLVFSGVMQPGAEQTFSGQNNIYLKSGSGRDTLVRSGTAAPQFLGDTEQSAEETYRASSEVAVRP